MSYDWCHRRCFTLLCHEAPNIIVTSWQKHYLDLDRDGSHHIPEKAAWQEHDGDPRQLDEFLLVSSPSVWFRHKALSIFGTREARQLLGEAGFSEERKDCFFSSRNNSWQLHRRIASASGGLHGSSSNARLTCCIYHVMLFSLVHIGSGLLFVFSSVHVSFRLGDCWPLLWWAIKEVSTEPAAVWKWPLPDFKATCNNLFSYLSRRCWTGWADVRLCRLWST